MQCTISIGKTIEARKLKPNEVPLVLGGLVKGLADQTSLPVDAILAMVSKAAHSNETPENEPAFSLTLT